MDEWMQLLMKVGGGFLCVATLMLGAMWTLRRKLQRRQRLVSHTSSSSSEWLPVAAFPKQSPLFQQCTRVVPQTVPLAAHETHKYPTAPYSEFGKITKKKLPHSFRSLDDLDSIPTFDDCSLLKTKDVCKQSDKSFNDQLSTDHRRSASMANLMTVSVENLGTSPEFLAEQWSTPTRHPTIEYSVTYASSTKALIVRVIRLINLSVKNHKSISVSVKIKLIRSSGSISESVVDCSKHAFDSTNGTYFAFAGHDRCDLRNYSLRFTVYQGKFKNLREKRVSQLEFSLAQLELVADVAINCIEKLQLTGKEKQMNLKKTNDMKLIDDNVQLMLSLFYQASANRMKVLVRKAVNLPMKKRRLRHPEYYIIVNAISGGIVMTSQETKKVGGNSTIWNQAFLFDLPEQDLNKYFLQFVVMSDKIGRQDGVIGQVVIGPDVRGLGSTHWKEALEPRSTEAAKWHKIQPF